MDVSTLPTPRWKGSASGRRQWNPGRYFTVGACEPARRWFAPIIGIDVNAQRPGVSQSLLNLLLRAQGIIISSRADEFVGRGEDEAPSWRSGGIAGAAQCREDKKWQ